MPRAAARACPRLTTTKSGNCVNVCANSSPARLAVSVAPRSSTASCSGRAWVAAANARQKSKQMQTRNNWRKARLDLSGRRKNILLIFSIGRRRVCDGGGAVVKRVNLVLHFGREADAVQFI